MLKCMRLKLENLKIFSKERTMKQKNKELDWIDSAQILSLKLPEQNKKKIG